MQGLKTLYILACCLLACAVVLDIAGKNQYSCSIRNRAINLKTQSTGQERIKQESKTALSIGNQFTSGGMVTAAAGLLFWIASAIAGRKQERRLSPVLPFGLLAAYVLIFFVCI
jgi:hypothetical protein